MKEPSGNLDFIKPFENQKSLTDAEKMEAAYKMYLISKGDLNFALWNQDMV